MESLNWRIIHTHDTSANWASCEETFIPKAGEFIVYDIDLEYDYERFKIGDGKTLLKDLPFNTGSLESIFNIENNVIYADAGRITDYQEQE